MPPEWQARQDGARYELKRLTKLKVTQALEEIKVDEMMASLEAASGEKKNRRAVVFYMDRGKSGSFKLIISPSFSNYKHLTFSAQESSS